MMGLPWWLSVKNPPANAGDTRAADLIPAVVHDGRRRQHGDLLDGQEAPAVELGGLAHAGTHLFRCGGGDAVMLAGPHPHAHACIQVC